MQRIWIILMSLSLFACASTGAGRGKQNKLSPEEAALPPAEIARVSQLSVDSLPPGQCGMLLWTLKANQPALIFRSVAGGTALAVLDGEELEFVSIRQKGDVRYGLGSEQYYEPIQSSAEQPAAGSIDVKVTYGEPFPGGIYVREGILKLKNADGWERVVPVAGLSGCRAS